MDITKNKATLKTLAKELNISVSTVSRAFTQPDSVKPATLAKIKEASDRLNYTPNLNARALVQQKTHIIGVILQSLRNQPTDALVRQITTLLSSKGYDIHIFVAYEDEKLNKEAIKSCICRGYDGVIINHSFFSGKMDAIETLIKEKIPFAVLGQYDYSPASQVIGDFRLSGMIMTKHLIELGHRKIAFVTNAECDPRFDGYCNMLQQNNLQLNSDLVFNCRCRQEEINKITKKILKTNATAVFANYDQMAIRIIRAFKEIGVKIPDEISIVGVGNEMYADLIRPELTTFEIDDEHLAENLVEALFERIERPDLPTRKILLNGKIVVRESTKKIAKNSRHAQI